jgi:hypothetical protein
MDLDQVDDVIFLLLLDSSDEEQPKRCVQTGQSGDEYIKELLDSSHPERILNVLRMQLATFDTLCDWLAINTDIKGSRITSSQRGRGLGKEGSIEEKLIVFLHIASKHASVRDTLERLPRSKRTISKSVYN